MKGKIKHWIELAKNNTFVKGRMERFKVIRLEPSFPKKILLYIWEWATMMPRFVWDNRHDTSLMISCGISLVVVSASVWIPGIIALITKGWAAMLATLATGIGVWNLPGTPFLLLVLGLGLAINTIYKTIKARIHS